MLDAYDPALRRLARETADELGIRVQEGVYLGLLGPSFETPAEIRAFRAWGADTVAMSVCEEVIAARHTGTVSYTHLDVYKRQGKAAPEVGAREDGDGMGSPGGRGLR